MIPLPEAVFFDWDGTLVDSFQFLRDAHSHVRNQIGRPDLTLEQFDHYFGMPRELLYQEIYGDEKEKAKELFEIYVTENHKGQLEPMVDAETLLKILHDKGMTMGVVSNKKPSFIIEEIKHFGWEDYFASVVGAGDADRDKPAPDPLFLAIEKAGVQSKLEDIWFVGDTETDLQCAKEAGCVNIFIQHKEDPVLIEKYEPSLVIKNCTDLCEFLLQTDAK